MRGLGVQAREVERGEQRWRGRRQWMRCEWRLGPVLGEQQGGRSGIDADDDNDGNDEPNA